MIDLHKELKRQRLITALSNLAGIILFILVVMLFVNLGAKAIDTETEWRADRLCQQGYHCSPEAGP